MVIAGGSPQYDWTNPDESYFPYWMNWAYDEVLEWTTHSPQFSWLNPKIHEHSPSCPDVSWWSSKVPPVIVPGCTRTRVVRSHLASRAHWNTKACGTRLTFRSCRWFVDAMNGKPHPKDELFTDVFTRLQSRYAKICWDMTCQDMSEYVKMIQDAYSRKLAYSSPGRGTLNPNLRWSFKQWC